jgi:AcrR family transcriptional regulator
MMASMGLLLWATASQTCILKDIYLIVTFAVIYFDVNKIVRRGGGDVPASSNTAKEPAPDAEAPAPVRRLRRAERREQIIAAATQAFACAGFAATSLDDIAAQAGISRAILYRHFDSKTDLYRAVLDRACARLASAVGTGDFTAASIDALVGAAAEDPDGFRLLFHHAAREPEFRAEMDQFHNAMVTIAQRELAAMIPDSAWANWAAGLAPAVAVEAVMAWLDAGQPDREQAADRIGQALDGIIKAAQPLTG